MCALAAAFAKPRKPSTKSEAPAPNVLEGAKTAYVRLWKGPFERRGNLQIELQAEHSKGPALTYQTAGAEVLFTEYVPLPAGPAVLIVKEGDGENGKEQRTTCAFSPDSFSTLILKSSGEEDQVETITDAPNAPKLVDAELTVRNFAPQLTKIQLHAGQVLDARLRGAEGYLHIRGLERQILQLETTTYGSDGKESKWANEVSFNSYRKATLLIYADPYGRIRPRVMIDGVIANSGKAPTGRRAEPESGQR